MRGFQGNTGRGDVVFVLGIWCRKLDLDVRHGLVMGVWRVLDDGGMGQRKWINDPDGRMSRQNRLIQRNVKDASMLQPMIFMGDGIIMKED